MILKTTDLKQIQRRKCQEKGCLNKAESIYKTKYLCGECKTRIRPTAIDKKSFYIRYLPQDYSKK